MKTEYIIILCIILVPVLVLAGNMTGSLLSTDNSVALGDNVVNAITNMVDYIGSLSDKATQLYDLIFSGEPIQPNEDVTIYSMHERGLMIEWEKKNGTMSWWQGWKLAMKYYFKTSVDTDVWNAQYDWDDDNPYVKYKN